MVAGVNALSEQVIVLTGASSGTGLCIAQLAALFGARLVFISHSTRMLDTLASTIQSSGGETMLLTADLWERDQAVAAAQAVVERFGRIDTWINNAGISIYGRLDEVSEADGRRLFDVNFWGVVNGSLAALPHLIAAGGSLINVGSELAPVDATLQGLYSSSKQAVKGFTNALRAEIEQGDGAPVSITLVEPADDGDSACMDPMRVAEAVLQAAGGMAHSHAEMADAWASADRR